MNARFTMILVFITSAPLTAYPQGQQVWLDYQVDYPFANAFLLEGTASYQTLIAGSEKWRSINVTPTFEWSFFWQLDLIVESPFSYTLQADDYSTVGIDPTLGFRLRVTENKRITTNLVVRLEERMIYDDRNGNWENSTRSRLRGEMFVALNKQNLFQDNLWWTITDYEEFFVVDQQLNERYANRRRFRVGLGYRINYKNRFEITYTWQSSRNEIETEFTRVDNVLQLRYKMFLNPAKPAATTN